MQRFLDRAKPCEAVGFQEPFPNAGRAPASSLLFLLLGCYLPSNKSEKSPRFYLMTSKRIAKVEYFLVL